MADEKVETERNLFHLVYGILVIALIYFNIIGVFSLFVLVVIGLIASIVNRRRKLPFFVWFLSRLERKKDLDNFPGRGALYITIGFLISVAFFPTSIALASIAILTFGDSLPALFGKRLGKVKHPFSEKRYIEGSIIGFIAAFLAAFLFVPALEALLGSLVALGIESIDSVKGRRIEDNISIPLVAGLVMFFIRLLV